MEEKDIMEMRRQLACLQEKLSDQQIINERLLRNSMQSKVSVIKHGEYFQYLSALLALVLYPIVAYQGMFSIALCTVTCVMMIFCIAATQYIHRPVNRTDLMTADLATVASVMEKFTKQYAFWLHYITPALIIPWLCWVCWEWLERNSDLNINPVFILLPILIGVLIGSVIGFIRHRKTVNAARCILQQIEE